MLFKANSFLFSDYIFPFDCHRTILKSNESNATLAEVKSVNSIEFVLSSFRVSSVTTTPNRQNRSGTMNTVMAKY